MRSAWGASELGPAISQAGQSALAWIGGNALNIIGTATRVVLSLLFAFVGLYYLLVRPGNAWRAIAPLIPFSPERTEQLRQRFEAVTWSTVVGTGLNAVVQGILLAAAFAVAGVPNAAFWGTVTAVLSVLPLVGSGLVWAPAAASLFMTGHPAAAIGIVHLGFPGDRQRRQFPAPDGLSPVRLNAPDGDAGGRRHRRRVFRHGRPGARARSRSSTSSS